MTEATSPQAVPASSRRPYLLAFAFVALVTVLQLTRQAGAPATDTIWAEDGRVFLSDALAENSPLLLFRPLAGYMHLVPRALAALAASLPLGAAAVVFAVGPALIVSCLALYSYSAFREVLPSVPVRVAFVTLVVLLPAAATESAANAANLHFFLVFGGFAALLHQPRSRAGAVAGGTFAFLAATSDPRAALLLPFALWNLYRGSRYRKAVALALLGGLVFQTVVVIASFGFGIDPTTALSAPQFQESRLAHIPVLYGVRVISHLFVGDRWLLPAWEGLGNWLAVAGLVVFAAVTTGLALGRSTRATGLLLMGYSVAYFAFQAMAWGTFGLWPYGGGWSGNSRYLLVPELLFAAGLGLLLEHLARERGGLWRGALVGFVVVLFAVVALHLRLEIVRSMGPRWSTELAQARDRCEGSQEEVAIPTTPPWSPDWAVTASCSQIR